MSVLTLLIAAGAVVVGLVAVGVQWVVTGRLFSRSVSLDQVLAMARIDESDIGTGLEGITQFYEWSQDRWGALAKGAGGAAVSVLLSVVGLAISEAATTTTTERSVEGTSATVAATAVDAIPELVTLLVFLSGIALFGWLRSARIHLDFAEDVATVSETRLPG